MISCLEKFEKLHGIIYVCQGSNLFKIQPFHFLGFRKYMTDFRRIGFLILFQYPDNFFFVNKP